MLTIAYFTIGLGLSLRYTEYVDDSVLVYLGRLALGVMFWPLAMILYGALLIGHLRRTRWLDRSHSKK